MDLRIMVTRGGGLLALIVLLFLPASSQAMPDISGQPAIFWQNATNGAIYYWLLNGTSVVSGDYLVDPGQIPAGWQIVGTPDLDGDGYADILWQNANTAAVYYWLLNGTTVTGGDYILDPNQISTDWQIVGTPDLNGDGWPDVLWQNTSDGSVYYWLMQGPNIVGGDYLVNPGQVSPDWRIVGTPDLNGDGAPDILWQNTSDGSVYYWLLNGTNFISGDYLVQPDQISTDWQIVGVPDLNGDGSPDILWQNTSDGSVYYWLMNGVNFVSGDYLSEPYQVSPDWQIVGMHS
ncbi:MAG TPA: VCBS repeat-containing protein [Chthonomonadaceae bacterium]|nr:VCBS repeat-containing protein [Chthonomonadaceae bacterium]